MVSCSIKYDVIWSKRDKTCKTTGMETLCPRNYVHILLMFEGNIIAAWIMFTRNVFPQ